MRIIDQLLWEGCGDSPRKCWDSPVEIHGQQWSAGGLCQGATGARTAESGAPGWQRHHCAQCMPEKCHYGQIISSLRLYGHLFPGKERCQFDAAPIAPQVQSFYGREACNVKPPNIDAAILLGARVLLDVTATGDINGVTAAKRSCSIDRQPAGRPLHLPAPGMAWNLLEGWSRLGLRRARRNALLRSSYMQPEPQHRERGMDPIAGAYRILSRTSF
ncbi:hypothetical protein TcCL_Unassigned03145 [Trypanosoma cruzi]|nr:hypothetical protein TcCL_Unassigned03145 [Trypanosoma cruzi]